MLPICRQVSQMCPRPSAFCLQMPCVRKATYQSLNSNGVASRGYQMGGKRTFDPRRRCAAASRKRPLEARRKILAGGMSALRTNKTPGVFSTFTPSLICSVTSSVEWTQFFDVGTECVACRCHKCCSILASLIAVGNGSNTCQVAGELHLVLSRLHQDCTGAA